MNFCKDCVYILSGRIDILGPHPLSICGCESNKKMNYVTGEYENRDCKDRNGDGLCIFYKEDKICKK